MPIPPLSVNAIRPYVNEANGLTLSARAMTAEMKVMDIHSSNIANFGIPGYQGQRTVRRPFIEHLGEASVESVLNTNVGRLRNTGVPTDLALSEAGYFQTLNPNTGVSSLTRDGRTQIDKEGYLRSLQGQLFLDVEGQPIRFSTVPRNADKEVKIDPDGSVYHLDLERNITAKVGRLSVVNAQQQGVSKPAVVQGFTEDSNVMLAEEFTAIMPVRRQFEANRQFFLIQSDSLSRLIQELGRAQ